MPTFYVSNINPAAQTLGTSGAFQGTTTAQPSTNSTTRVINIATATAQSMFKFYADQSDDTTGTSSTDITPMTPTGSFTFATPDASRSTEFIKLLAKDVFGSEEAIDFFTNYTDIVSGWDTSAGTALTSLNNKLIAAGTGQAACKELIDAMFAGTTRTRFAFNSGTTITGTALTDGTGLAVTSTANGTGSGALVAVTMASSPGASVQNIAVTTNVAAALAAGSTARQYVKGETIEIETPDSSNKIAITLNSVQASMLNGTLDDITSLANALVTGATVSGTGLANGSGLTVTGASGVGGATVNTVCPTGSSVSTITIVTTGTGYAKNDAVQIVSTTAGNTINITLTALQAALLNGEFVDPSGGVEVPLVTGDVLRTLYTINSNGSQTNINGDAITTSQTFFVDYTLN